MDIVLNYDNSVNQAPQGFRTAMQFAADALDKLITNTETVTIGVGYGEVAGQPLGQGVLGESSPNFDTLPYSEIKNALAANAVTQAAKEAVAHLPAADPTGGMGVQVAYAQERALGIAPSNTYPVAGYVGFANATNAYFDYSTSGTPATYQYDFVGVAEHELTHALGRVTNLGYPDPLSPATVMDLFQYASPGVLATGTAEPSYFSIDGGAHNLGTFDNTSDCADWASSNGPDSFDAYANSGVINPLTPADKELMNVLGFQVACFASGTRILTTRGAVPVETLRPGEDIAITASGRRAPIAWTGWRSLVPARQTKPLDVTPVRVAAGAVADGTPARDVYLSPDHALSIGGRLIPVRYLLNGRTIVQVPVPGVTYWHVELDRHDLLLADGLPAESYLDTGNRAAFVNGGTVVMLPADFARGVWAREGCAPLLTDGPDLVRIRRELAERAATLGWRVTANPDLHLLAACGPVTLVRANGQWQTDLPEGTATAYLLSRTWVPAEVWPDGTDHRSLGVAMARLWLDGREVALDSPALSIGWHAPEPDWRWTAGCALLDLTGVRRLAFSLAMTGHYPVLTAQRAAVAA